MIEASHIHHQMMITNFKKRFYDFLPIPFNYKLNRLKKFFGVITVISFSFLLTKTFICNVNNLVNLQEQRELLQ